MTSLFFTYDKGKVLQALRYHFISRKEIKVMMILVNVFAIISAALFFIRKISPLAFLLSSSLWFVLMVAFWFVLPAMILRKTDTFRDKLRVTLSDNGFIIENSKGSRNWPWKDFSFSMESPYFFHLYFDNRSFFIIPKEAFPGNDVNAARKILETKIPK